MIRQIIKIDEDKCNGCNLCVKACHEGAIGIVGGKAKLLRDDFCDGLGNCLPVCPTGAITFENRETLRFDKEAVEKSTSKSKDLSCGCPGTNAKEIRRGTIVEEREKEDYKLKSELNQWPVQIKLIPVDSPYFDQAHLLIAADCTAYAYANFHNEFIKDKIIIIGCPKLDNEDYSEKLTEILKNNNIQSVTVLKMEVPCCTGILNMTKEALKKCEKFIPWQVYTVSIDGTIIK